MLLTVSGILTGSVYMDVAASGVLFGSRVCPIDNVMFVKTHSITNNLLRDKCNGTNRLNFRKAVYIIRNPFKSRIAEFNRQKVGKTSVARREIFTGPGKDTGKVDFFYIIIFFG